ncbi:transcriptional regulator with XRE-family HTH domain [Microbacterium sp. SORGH_AS 1204]|uniref:helix-turn-helix transcriptional regulator n=1 Tax=Microbacterium sp. SORGH_AS_1204 TaxID=3041785 RepID=UPI002791F61E|nr:helix-turn-helix transcriptional regulator [Microbacterium sp. SORGH_AS_1204]MDQ1137156.1 transcriptional regulator with XRE-family HTH domain [Microbacterium sp. SORGH_AS_1204]
MSRSDDARAEFAGFLRSRRARLRPADVGLPDGSRRRVAGLRREEVAQLAGVGLTWYTWLEQGRPIAASAQVVAAIARALRLSDDERDHLFALADLPVPDREPRPCVSTAHLDLLEKLLPYPAAVQTARFDIRAYNRSYRYLFDDLDAVPVDDRNCAVLLFTDTAWQRSHVDLDHAQRRIAARLRAAYGRHHEEPSWQRFIADLEARSPRFAELWRLGDVGGERNAVKHLVHAGVGELDLEMSSLWIDDGLGSRVVWFAPRDAVTGARLEQLAAERSEEALISAVA